MPAVTIQEMITENPSQFDGLGIANKVDKTTTINGKPLTANVTLTKADIDIANVDNTSDANKPVSTAQLAAINAKVENNLTSSTTVAPSKDAVIAALANKQATLASGTNIKTINGVSLIGSGDIVIEQQLTAGSGATAYSQLTDKGTIDLPSINVPLSNALTAKQALLVSGTNIKTINGSSILGSGDIVVSGSGSGASTFATLTDKNTVDLPTINTPLSTALALRAPLNNPTFTGTVSGITKTMIGLSNVDNTSDASKPISSATQTALNTKQATLVSGTTIKTINGVTLLGSGDIVISGSGGSTTFAALSDKSTVDLPTVNSPLSTALSNKAPIASPTFTGTVSGITKAMVGLSDADNTSDANKPISTATQTALNAKQATLVSGTNIKTINGASIVGAGNITVGAGGTLSAYTASETPPTDTTVPWFNTTTGAWAVYFSNAWIVTSGGVSSGSGVSAPTSPINKISGISGAHSGDSTWQKLSADASANSSTAFSSVMVTTNLAAGDYLFEYVVRFQSSSVDAGVKFKVDFSGAATGAVIGMEVQSKDSVLTTGASNPAARIMENYIVNAFGGVLGPTYSVESANTDYLTVIKGRFTVTTSGNLSLSHASEVAASTIVKAGTLLKLDFIG